MILNTVTIDGIKQDIVYTAYNFPEEIFFNIPTIRDRHGNTYYNIECAFDIETSTIQERVLSESKAFMYHWQFCIHNTVVFGRTWEEYCLFIEKIGKIMELSKSRILVIYVHNLSYEAKFLESFFKFDKVFSRSKRKPIRINSGGIEYRCSYILSNMSLYRFCKNTPKCKYYKLEGEEYDYNKIRTPETKLTESELQYCYNDVRGLCECIRHRLETDTIVSIPMTSTGYVRREFRKEMKKSSKNYYNFKKLALNETTYKLMKSIFRGGDTHANYIYSGELLENVHSYDKSSSYPAAIMYDKYPVTRWKKVNDNLFPKYNKKDTAYIGVFRFKNIVLKKGKYMPYIDHYHCKVANNERLDNGRILSASEIIIPLCDVDVNIILNTYNIESMSVSNLYTAKKGYLPIEERKLLLKMYREKTRLKKGDQYEYNKYKNAINSVYGMQVTDIVRDNIEYKEGEYIVEKQNIKEALNRYYNNPQSFLSYQHGVYVTANARKRLRDAIDLIGEDIVYVDTDSVKYIGNHEEDFKKLNEEIIKSAKECTPNACCVVDGKEYIMGLWEKEKTSDRFITWGSKKYCVEKEGKVVTTVAGLSKELGSKYLNEHGGIKKFKLGITFPENYSGRMTAVYSDKREPTKIRVVDYEGKESEFTYGSYLALVPTTYILGVTNEYYELINSDDYYSEFLY